MEITLTSTRCVTLPARSVAYAAGLRSCRDRVFLTTRPLSHRMELPMVLNARRQHARAHPGHVSRGVSEPTLLVKSAADRDWSALATVALLVAIVLVCVRLAHLA